MYCIQNAVTRDTNRFVSWVVLKQAGVLTVLTSGTEINRFVKREKIEAPFKFNSENMCAKCRNCSDTPCLNYVLFKMSTDKSSIVLLKIRLYHYWINGVLRTNNKIQRQHRLKTELRAIVK